jgi:DNA-binding beta-propeller fold protein YncE
VSFRKRKPAARSWTAALVTFVVTTFTWALLLLTVFSDGERSARDLGGAEPWTNRLYVVNARDRNDSVMIVDARRSRERVVQSTGSGADAAIGLSADGSQLVAVSRRCGEDVCRDVMSVIDTRWGNVDRLLALSWPGGRTRVVRATRPSSAPSLAVSPDGRYAYLWVRESGHPASVATIDIGTGSVLPATAGHPDIGCLVGSALVPLPDARGVAIVCAASDHVLFLTIADNGGLLRLDTVDLPTGATDDAGPHVGHPVTTTTSSDLRRLYVATSMGRVFVIGLDTHVLETAVDLSLPTGRLVASGASLSFSDTRSTLFIALRPSEHARFSSADVIRVVDASSWETLVEVTLKRSFEAMTRTPGDTSLLVYDRRRSGLRMIDPVTGSDTRVLNEIRRPKLVVVPLLAE